MATCPKCQRTLQDSEFHWLYKPKGIRRKECKACRPKPSKEATRRANLKKKFDLTLEEYDEMLAAQGGVCASCGTATPGGRGRFHVDHNHETGQIRGLLCHGCNLAYGFLRENPHNILSLLDYHYKYSQEEVQS